MMQDQVGIGHNGGPPLGAPVAPPWLAGREARIARRGRPAATSGKARAEEWVLRFERTTPPVVEPLMGWTGGGDTLATQVELTFGSREEALAYAERQGIEARVKGAGGQAPEAPPARQRVQRPENAFGTVIWLTPLESSYGRCDPLGRPDLERALLNPAAVFGAPDEVLRDPLLSLDCRREILRRWAWDEYLKDMAAEEGMPEHGAAEPSRLWEVKAALLALGEDWRPSPVAPSARIAPYERDPRLALAA